MRGVTKPKHRSERANIPFAAMALTIQRARDELADARRAAALGIDQPAGWWPTAPRLKSYEAAGFTHVALVQVGGDTQEHFISWAATELLTALRAQRPMAHTAIGA